MSLSGRGIFSCVMMPCGVTGWREKYTESSHIKCEQDAVGMGIDMINLIKLKQGQDADAIEKASLNYDEKRVCETLEKKEKLKHSALIYELLFRMRSLYNSPRLKGERGRWCRDGNLGYREMGADFPKVWESLVPDKFKNDTRRANIVN